MRARVVGASDGPSPRARNANEILDEAHPTFAGFLAAARESAAANPDVGLAVEEPGESVDLPTTVAEVEFLDVGRENVAATVWATGYDDGYCWLEYPSWMPGAGRSGSAGSRRCRRCTSWAPHWTHTFTSGLLAGVGSDAEYLAEGRRR